MRDASANLLRASRAVSRAAIAAALLAACALGGCANTGAGSGSFAMASGGGSTVAFESIDGPAPQVFDLVVRVLAREPKLGYLAILSRQGSAPYLGRSY